jgi:hypothetical protein
MELADGLRERGHEVVFLATVDERNVDDNGIFVPTSATRETRTETTGVKAAPKLLAASSICPSVLNTGASPRSMRLLLQPAIDHGLAHPERLGELRDPRAGPSELNWLFGLGPAKGVLTQLVDNDFLRITRDFGIIVGILFVVAITLFVGRAIWCALRGDVRAQFSAMVSAVLFVATLVMSITADVLYQVQIMSVILLVGGILVGSRTIRDTVRRV